MESESRPGKAARGKDQIDRKEDRIRDTASYSPSSSTSWGAA